MKLKSVKNSSGNEFGFTIIELLTYISLASVIFVGAYYVFVKSTDIYVNVLRSSTAVQNAHSASELIEREAKNVKNNASVIIATSTQFKFTNTSNTVIDLVYSSQQIKKNTVAYASGISSFAFSYYKWDGTTWTSASPTNQIAKIRYVFTIAYQGYSFSKDNYILLRNMR
ncbi:hypothetical protein F9K33_00305 [bacterium]|nr:MAG: hypothetical protein F9K33_00305 [bacterium]